MARKSHSMQGKISAVDITNDTISGRGALFFFLRFVENIGFYSLIEKRFGFLNRSGKGLRLRAFVKQILAYFVDGSDTGMVSFDRRKKDPAYAMLLETSSGRLASSHQMKRFFQKLMVLTNPVYRRLLLYLFMWRLNVEKPKVIVLFVDSRVFDNNNAQKHEGVEPTYMSRRKTLKTSVGYPIIDRPGATLNKDELTHRALSAFATKEQFPFKRMAMNRAYYYFLVISHFLYEAYKQAMPEGIVSPCCYPHTFRRTVIDFAVKMVRRGRRIILKVTQAIWESLRIRELWQWPGQLEPALCMRT